MKREKTKISKTIDATNEKIRLDTNVKKILANKYILAWVLKYTVIEFQTYEICDIIECIEGEPEISSVPVDPGMTNIESIAGMNTEDAVPNEGKIYFDIVFYVILPNGEPTKLIINLEAQKSFYPGYDLVTRGIFYGARMISSQLDREFSNNTSDKIKYDGLKKVYSIWICMDSPKRAENTITEYSIQEKTVYGQFGGKARYDLMSIVMVCLSREEQECENELLNMLTTLLSDTLDIETKKQILEEQYNIPMEIELEREVNEMCNYSEYIEEKGIEKGKKLGMSQGIEKGKKLGMSQGIEKGKKLGISQGIEKGRKLGISQGIRMMMEENRSKDEIIQKLVKYYSLTEREAEEYYDNVSGEES